MVAPTTLRQRKKRRTREALVEAAYALFAERGFEQVTVDAIAERAEISRRTFFRYFATKEAVVFPDREGRLARFESWVRARQPGESGFEAVSRACLKMAEEYMADRHNLVRQQRIIDQSPALAAYEREVDREWEALVADALVQRAPDDPNAERRARVLASALIGAVMATLREWLASGGQGDLVAMGRQALGWLADGFVTEGPV